MNSMVTFLLSNPLLFAVVAVACITCAWQIVCLLGVRKEISATAGRGIFAQEASIAKGQNQEAQANGARLERSPDLIAAGLRISTRTWLAIRYGSALFVLIASFFAGAPLIGFLAGAGIVGGSALWLSTRKKKALGELEKQVLQLEMQMAENSRAGLSVEKSLRTCLEHAERPIQEHLERMVNELTYSNRTLSDVFASFAQRSGSADVRLLANVIAVQQETGSNLADTLDFLAQTINEKQRMRQTLRSRVAEMQLTKIMVAAAPVLVFAICCMAISGVSEFYLTNPIGWVLLAVCATADLGGIFALNKMSEITID